MGATRFSVADCPTDDLYLHPEARMGASVT